VPYRVNCLVIWIFDSTMYIRFLKVANIFNRNSFILCCLQAAICGLWFVYLFIK